ncbi:hypothetical protein HS7_10270 [Sulfolobales archaeon HS-7]|nr:hypothetical protein HS7_10270 [Sulfolobales archaeon HS-7]
MYSSGHAVPIAVLEAKHVTPLRTSKFDGSSFTIDDIKRMNFEKVKFHPHSLKY